jgi:hypothetical protein
LWDSFRRRKEKERKQADQISGWLDFLPSDEIGTSMEVQLILINASNQLAYNLIASIVTAHGGDHPGNTFEYRTFVGRLPPGRSEYTIKHPGHGMHKRFAVELAFDDAGSRTWVRHGRGRLERIKSDPLSHYKITPPVGWRMP